MMMADGGGDLRRTKRAPARGQTAVCVVIRAETLPNVDEEFEALVGDLAYSVCTDEQGCLSYVVTRLLGTRTHFAVHARFADRAAFERHAETPHLTRALPRLSALLATPVSLEIFAEI